LITEDIAETLINSCTWIRISVDAATPEVYQKVHGMGEKIFNKTLNNLKMLVKKKKRLKSAVTIGVGFLTCEYTKRDMRRAAKLFKEIGVDYLQFRPMQIHDRGRFIYHPLDIEKEIKIGKL